MAVKKSPEPTADVAALARAAGLDKTLKQFPNDVAAAVRAATNARNAMPALDDATAEPWPPMRTRSTT